MTKPLTDLHIAKIEKLAGLGCTLDQIAIACDVSEATLKRWRKNKEVDRAYQRGRVLAHEQIAGKLFELAMAGDVASLIFWLKAQSKWTDRLQEDAPAAVPQVVVYLPDNQR